MDIKYSTDTKLDDLALSPDSRFMISTLSRYNTGLIVITSESGGDIGIAVARKSQVLLCISEKTIHCSPLRIYWEIVRQGQVSGWE